jgi:hypothetical protein
MLSRTVSTWVDSCCCPAVTSTARGTPEPSVTKWNLLPNPPFERPRAWSSGSSRCFWRLFLKRLQRREMPLPKSRRCTTNPNRSGPCDPGESVEPVVYGRKYHRLASGKNSDTPSSKDRIALANPATEHRSEGSRVCRSAFVVGPWVCALSWRYSSVTVPRWIPIVRQLIRVVS